MTDTYSTQTSADRTSADDIVTDTGTSSFELDRAADAILRDADAPDTGPRPLRQAVREDATMARDWGRDRAERLRDAVETEPVKATLYALGLGVVIGLLIAR